MKTTDLTPDDMSNLFLAFKIPTDLYKRWADYAKDTHKTMKGALAELLHSCAPGCYYLPDSPKENRMVVRIYQKQRV